MRPTTLGDLARFRVGVRCWCGSRRHRNGPRGWVLDEARMAAALGPGWPVPELARAVICTGCGNTRIEVSPDWPAAMPDYRYPQL